MSVLLFTLTGFCLLVVQTVLMPWLGGYDLLVPLVVFLGLRRRLWDGLMVVVLIGIVVDGLSAASTGYYLTAYMWIWAVMRLLIRYLRVANTFLLPLVIAGAVLLENLVFLAIPLLVEDRSNFAPTGVGARVAAQMAWALLTGPLLLAFFGQAQLRLRRYQAQAAARRAVKDE